jgi:hypothetical protein
MKKIVKKILCLSLGVISAIGVGMINVPANAASLSQKDEYYKQYQVIVKEAKEKYNADITLDPIDSINEKDMVSPKEFKKFIDKVGNNEFKVEIAKGGTDTLSLSRTSGSVPASKNATIKTDSKSFTIKISANFYTMLGNSRQIIDSVEDISSKSTGTGTWKQVGEGAYDLIDGRRTAEVTVQGNLKYSGMNWNGKDATVSFYCTSAGDIR